MLQKSLCLTRNIGFMGFFSRCQTKDMLDVQGSGEGFPKFGQFQFLLRGRGGGVGGLRGGLKKDVFVGRYLWMPPNEKMVTDSQGSFA